MMNKSAFLLVGLSASALAFGGNMGGVILDPEHDECDKCVCASDRGSIDDPNAKKCCPTEPGLLPGSWDDFCDALMAETCKDVCTNDKGEAITRRESTAIASRATGGNKQGGTCGSFFQGHTLLCSRGLYCVGGPRGTCMTFQEAAKATLIDLDEDFSIANVITNCDGGVEFAFDMSSEDLQRLVQTVSTRLEVGVGQNNLGFPVQDDDNKTTFTWSAPNDAIIPGESNTCFDNFDFGVRKAANQRGERMARQLYNSGVRLLDYDWDLTANTKHTFQKTYSSVEQVADLMSRDYIDTVKAWCRLYPQLQSHVVTYNDAQMGIGKGVRFGPDVIQEALRIALGDDCGSRIKVYARQDRSTDGKNCHIESSMRDAGITDPSKVVLVDDTKDNIVQALSMDYQTVWVNPANGFTFDNFNTYKDKCPDNKRCNGKPMACRKGSITAFSGGAGGGGNGGGGNGGNGGGGGNKAESGICLFGFDACSCAAISAWGCGWSSGAGLCMEGKTTDCDECSTQAACFGGGGGGFVDQCVGGTTPCTCAALAAWGCGWSTENDKCLEGKTTDCDECPTQAACFGGGGGFANNLWDQNGGMLNNNQVDPWLDMDIYGIPISQLG